MQLRLSQTSLAVGLSLLRSWIARGSPQLSTEFSLFKKKLLYYFMCVTVACMYVCVTHAFLVLLEVREAIRSS